MEIEHTETNRGNKAIIVGGYIYRKVNVLKNGNVVYACSVSKTCKKSITLNPEGDAIVKVRNNHDCQKEPNTKKTEARQLRFHLRKQCQGIDLSVVPTMLITSEIARRSEENRLDRRDIKNAALSLYRHCRKRRLQTQAMPTKQPLTGTGFGEEKGHASFELLGHAMKEEEEESNEIAPTFLVCEVQK